MTTIEENNNTNEIIDNNNNIESNTENNTNTNNILIDEENTRLLNEKKKLISNIFLSLDTKLKTLETQDKHIKQQLLDGKKLVQDTKLIATQVQKIINDEILKRELAEKKRLEEEAKKALKSSGSKGNLSRGVSRGKTPVKTMTNTTSTSNLRNKTPGKSNNISTVNTDRNKTPAKTMPDKSRNATQSKLSNTKSINTVKTNLSNTKNNNTNNTTTNNSNKNMIKNPNNLKLNNVNSSTATTTRGKSNTRMTPSNNNNNNVNKSTTNLTGSKITKVIKPNAINSTNNATNGLKKDISKKNIMTKDKSVSNLNSTRNNNNNNSNTSKISPKSNTNNTNNNKSNINNGINTNNNKSNKPSAKNSTKAINTVNKIEENNQQPTNPTHDKNESVKLNIPTLINTAEHKNHNNNISREINISNIIGAIDNSAIDEQLLLGTTDNNLQVSAFVSDLKEHKTSDNNITTNNNNNEENNNDNDNTNNNNDIINNDTDNNNNTNKDPSENNKEKIQQEVPKLSINEILEEHLSKISSYLTHEEMSNSLILTNKNITKQVMISINNNHVPKIEEKIKEKLTTIKDKYTEKDYKKDQPEFKLSKGTVKAIDLLNEKMYNKLFEDKELRSEEILLPFRLLFQLINNKEILESNKEEFWLKTCEYFLKQEGEAKTGDFLIEQSKNFDLSLGNVYKLYKILNNNSHKITPNYYSKLCGTTGLIIFVIKDSLEYLGLILEKKTHPLKAENTFNAFKNNVNKASMKYKEIIEKL